MFARSLCIATAIAVVSFTAPSVAQERASAEVACATSSPRVAGRLPWFNGFTAGDDLMTAWCRIQSLGGSRVRFNVLFPETKAHRSWDTSFDGPPQPASRIIEIVQSLLPVGDGPAADENGMEFHRVLLNVVQASAAKTPSGLDLGFPASHPASKELILWEPIVMRIKPVVLAGQEFTMNVVLRPNLGFLSLALQQRATDVQLMGWRNRLNIGSKFQNKCSSQIPFCEAVPEVATFHAPWVVTGVSLEAFGDNLSNSALFLMNHLNTTQAPYMKGVKPLLSFNRSTGSGRLAISDGISTMNFEAKGSAGVTKQIRITWDETRHAETYHQAFARALNEYKNGKKEETNPAPAVPDSLDRL